MVYFQLSRVGFNCGCDKKNCTQYPEYCEECVKNRLKKLGLEANENAKIVEMDSEEKRIEMFRNLIWHKFLDVLNIKHIVLMAKDSGLLFVNYPISGAGVDVELLTGFLQANITFSESGNKSNYTDYFSNYQFYELQYKTFSILLRNGKYVRICLVLDHKPSENLKSNVIEFLQKFEIRYKDNLLKVLKSGVLELDHANDFITSFFNIKLIYPMVLTHSFLPEILDSINKNYIQKALIKLAREYLATKQFFFVNNIINEVKKIVDIDAKIILYEIYQLLISNVIIPTSLETAERNLNTFRESHAMRIADNKLISPIIADNKAIYNLKNEVKDLSPEQARKLMKSFIKKGETAEKALVYKEAMKEYEKALYLATGFDFKNDIGKISFMILETDKKIKQMEIDYAETKADKLEKDRDYINALRFYRIALQVLEDYTILNNSESRIKKLEKKIAKLQKQI
jgi:tetratricopeptide (TPR) repeat protein